MARSSIEYEDAPADVMKRLVAGARKGVEAAVDLWDREMLPDHFEEGAGERYGFAKRSGEGEPPMVYSDRGYGREVKRGGVKRRLIKNPKYFHRKAREGFGKRPLVRTGESARMAMAGGKTTSRVDGGVVEGTDSIPAKAEFFKHPFNKASGRFIDKPAELTAVAPGEETTLGRVVENVVARQVEKPGRRRTKSV